MFVKYVCKICGRKFKKYASLGAHISHHGVKIIECHKCGRKIDEKQFEAHARSHKKDKPCAFCGKITMNDKFCSRSCSTSFTNRKQHKNLIKTHKCFGCDKQIKLYKFCSILCRKNFQYKNYIEKWLKGLESGNSGLEGVRYYVRKWVFERAKNKCEGILENGLRCNWARINLFTKKQPLCVHHKDGNSKNTTPENLELLCPSCHSLTKNYGSLNKGNGREGRKLWGFKKLRK